MELLLIGSFNGQDSFGDHGLLRSVTTQFQRALGPDVRCVTHVHNGLDRARAVAPEVRIEIGWSSPTWRWFTLLRRLRLPYSLHLIVAFLTLPFWLVATGRNRKTTRRVLRDVRRCSGIYFYGGTQLSEQWFDLNFPPLVMLIAVGRLLRKPVFFGPQQFGPQLGRQAAWLRFVVGRLVTDVRTRNTGCLGLLDLPQSKLLADEIFSCVPRYPISVLRTRARSFLLVNMRASNFLRDADGTDFQRFGVLLAELHRLTGLPFKLFQMSGASFCDDTRFMDHLERQGRDRLPIELVPRFHGEAELIDMARTAYGTLSMSFHGCILSIIGGCPAVPVRSGAYYEYKYRDFERYTGGQAPPLVDLDAEPTARTAADIAEYYEAYDPRRTMKAREMAAEAMSGWYREIGSAMAAQSVVYAVRCETEQS